MLLRDRATDGRDDVVQLLRAFLAIAAQRARIHLDRDRDVVPARFVERERRRASRAERDMLSFGGELEILRVMFQTANNQQILEPPGDDQLSVAQDAEVAGSKKWSVAVCERGGERLGRQLLSSPVARATLGDATQISPISPSAHDWRVSGSTMTTRVPNAAVPQATDGRVIGVSLVATRNSPRAIAPASAS